MCKYIQMLSRYVLKYSWKITDIPLLQRHVYVHSKKVNTHELCFMSLMFYCECTSLPFEMLHLCNAAHRPANKTRHDGHHGGRKSNFGSHQIGFLLSTLYTPLKLVHSSNYVLEIGVSCIYIYHKYFILSPLGFRKSHMLKQYFRN